MRYLFVLFCSFGLLGAFDITKVALHTHQVKNGTTLLVEFLPQQGVTYKEIRLGKKHFQVLSHPLKQGKKYALVAFDYYMRSGNKNLEIVYNTKNQEMIEKLLIKVVDGKYEKEEIRVSSSKVNPQSKEVQNRISQEYNEAMRIYNTKTRVNYLTSPFVMPMKSHITSAFGKARTYNGSLKGYHSGTDFRAAVGTKIHAVNDGVVALVAKRFYSGGTVLLDHGNAIYTCYFHMSQMGVRVGEKIKKGDLLGLSGATGRVTGPHLHFAVRVGGVQVDPMAFLELINKNLLQNKG